MYGMALTKNTAWNAFLRYLNFYKQGNILSKKGTVPYRYLLKVPVDTDIDIRVQMPVRSRLEFKVPVTMLLP